ncbi:uncharacterized protein [Hemitrygon akajei]|uniref:uncharacterized protein n=1 Tax=Hemitrygon akajei TaxID=2704970 RepID=UPI003BF967DA
MVERLKRSDGGRYRCRVELNVGNFQTAVLTDLSVRAPNESVSVMTGTEGASATLPCVFTQPQQSLTAHTVMWMRKNPDQHIVTFRHIQNGSWAAENRVTRYELVEDPELGNAWIRIKQLRVEDSHSYLCLAEFRKGNHDYSSYGNHVKPPFIHVIQSEIQLQVRPAPNESVSVMTGTEGASATLPCVFTRPRQSLTAHTVTWMRKDPYRHIVTFRRIRNGSWAAENGVTRYELVGDPELGNAWIRIKQLRVEDSHSYLCLAEFRKSEHDYYHLPNGDHIKPPYIHVIQSEIQLQVTPGTGASETVLMLCIPLGLKTLALLVMGAVLYGDKLRKRQD